MTQSADIAESTGIVPDPEEAVGQHPVDTFGAKLVIHAEAGKPATMLLSYDCTGDCCTVPAAVPQSNGCLNLCVDKCPCCGAQHTFTVKP